MGLLSWYLCCCCLGSKKTKYDSITDAKSKDVNKPLLPDNTQYELKGVPKDKTWYHGNISDKEANVRLMNGAKGVNGSYLVYNNPSQKEQLILLVYYKGEGVRWKIQNVQEGGMFVLGDDGPDVPKYRDVKELIKDHRGISGKPIKMENNEVVTLSKLYVHRPT